MQLLKATDVTDVMNTIESEHNEFSSQAETPSMAEFVSAELPSPELPANDQIVVLPNDLFHDLPETLPDIALKIEPVADTIPIETRNVFDSPFGDNAAKMFDLCEHDRFAFNLASSIFKMHPEFTALEFYEELVTAQGIEKPAGQQSLKLAITPVEVVLKTVTRLLIPEMRDHWIALGVFTSSFDIEAAAFIWRLPKSRAGDVLNILKGYGLINYNEKSDRFQSHESIQRFACNQLQDEERSDLQYLHATHYQIVLHSADLLFEQGGGRIKNGIDLLRIEMPNISLGQKWAAEYSSQLREACELSLSYPDSGKHILALSLQPDERIVWIESAMNASKLLKRRKAMGRNLCALGNAHFDKGDIYKAIECYERSHDISKSINDGGGKADALRGLGFAYYFRGELTAAKKHFDNAIASAKEANSSVIERICFGRLGMIHYLLGEFDSARSLFVQQLNAAQLTGDHISEGAALSGLGLLDYQMGNYEDAIEYFSSHLYISNNLNDKRGQALASLHLGATYAAQKDGEKSINTYAVALRIAREAGDRMVEASALGGLGIGHFLNREFDASTQFIEHHLRLSTEIGDRLGAALARVYLGSVCISKNEIKRAVKLFQEAYNVYLDTGDIRGRADTLFKLSLALELFGDRVQALSHAQNALELYEKAGLPAAENVRRQLQEWK